MSAPKEPPQRVEIVNGVGLGFEIFWGWLLGAIVLVVLLIVVVVMLDGETAAWFRALGRQPR